MSDWQTPAMADDPRIPGVHAGEYVNGLNYYRAVYVRHNPLLAVVAGRYWGGVPKTKEAPGMQQQ
jgi:hypothetical protein